MAVTDMTTLNLSGKFSLNKEHSDANRDQILAAQGVSWLKRSAIAYGYVTLHVTHTKGDDGIERINIAQTLTGGFEGTTENRILDWTERENEDHIFGAVIGKSRRINPEKLDNEYLKKGWLPDVYEHGAIQAWVKSNELKSGTDWIAEQIWGFEEVEIEPGKRERRWVRHVHFIGPSSGGKKVIQCKLVYDYLGPDV